MIGKLLRLGSRIGSGYLRYELRKHRTEVAVGVGIVGTAITAAIAYRTKRRTEAVRGKVVLVTGGSRGLGLEIARVFGLHGAHLVLASRNHEELQTALGILEEQGAIANGSTALTVACDVTDPNQCRELCQRAVDRYGRIDVLVNNAGIIDVAPFQDQPLQAFEQSMRTNFFGALHMVRAALPHMVERGSGNIVNIASIGGKIGVPHMLPYVASKYALVGFSEGLRAEMSGTGVQVTTVCPGLMRTGSHGHARFGGNADAEFRWFSLGATLPGASASARHAAHCIYNATVEGRAEITITPQAWLAARIVGVAPGLAADVAGLMCRLFLPAPNGNTRAVPGSELKQPQSRAWKAWSQKLQTSNNQAG